MESLMKDRLNEIIEKKRLTATKFATLIDANPSAISHLLKGRNKPGYDLLVNIARAFPDISMDWLLTGKGKMSVQQEIPEPTPIGTLFDAAYGKQEETPPEETKAAVPSEPAARFTSEDSGKSLKRIILFFSDGSFEDYRKD